MLLCEPWLMSISRKRSAKRGGPLKAMKNMDSPCPALNLLFCHSGSCGIFLSGTTWIPVCTGTTTLRKCIFICHAGPDRHPATFLLHVIARSSDEAIPAVLAVET
jgi:hypothetical protein